MDEFTTKRITRVVIEMDHGDGTTETWEYADSVLHAEHRSELTNEQLTDDPIYVEPDRAWVSRIIGYKMTLTAGPFRQLDITFNPPPVPEPEATWRAFDNIGPVKFPVED